jgi:hypothetical protein
LWFDGGICTKLRKMIGYNARTERLYPYAKISGKNFQPLSAV